MILKNDGVIKQLESEFQRTNDASFAVESLVSIYLALPVLRLFYPMSAVGGSSFWARDLSTNGHHLNNTGVQFGYAGSKPLVPVANFGAASTDRLYLADATDFYVAGNEAAVISAARGLTIGAWVLFTDLGTANECIIGQWDAGANERAYMIYATTSSQIGAYVSSNGTAYTNKLISSANHGVSNQEWHFLCLQWSPSAQDDFLRMWVDDYSEQVTPVAYATLHDSTANFGIGHNYSTSSAQNYFEGRISMAFMCACNLGSANIRRLYYRTRPAFQSRNLW